MNYAETLETKRLLLHPLSAGERTDHANNEDYLMIKEL